VEGLSFLENGDLIVGNINSVMRLNKVDGATVWQTYRLAYGDGAELAVYGSKIYGIINDLTQLKVAAFDTSDGQLLYKTEAIDNGLVQQQALFLGNDGTIYLPRSQNNPITDSLYSFTDNGAGFTQNWSVPIHYIPFSSSGIGLDGSVYSYSRSGKVIRIDPITGTITDSSQVILYGNASYPRMTIDAAGRVFVTNGGFSDGAFFSFNSDLTLRWQTPISNVYIGGPLIGWDGTLVICGVGNDIRAYRGDTTAETDDILSNTNSTFLFPNPFQDKLNLQTDASLVGLYFVVYDYLGKSVIVGNIESERTTLDLSNLSSGIYLLCIENKKEFMKIIKD
jgi:hypothetical protein